MKRILAIAAIAANALPAACAEKPAPTPAAGASTPAAKTAAAPPAAPAAAPAAKPADYPRPPSWNFPEVVESARAIAPRNAEGRVFDKHGLAYPLKELDALPYATMGIAELAKYADIVTTAYPDACGHQIDGGCPDVKPEWVNSTTLANMAYVSLHAADAGVRERSAACFAKAQAVVRAAGLGGAGGAKGAAPTPPAAPPAQP
jgi:hypothetical protein